MNLEQAETVLKGILAPLPLETFLDALGRSVLHVPAGQGSARAALFGDDPVRTALSAFATHSDRLDCHGVDPQLPPPEPREVTDEAGLRALVHAYHERGYTVRMPEVVSLSPPLRSFVRALEFVLHQPVDASLFWSRAGAGAIVHYDNRDNLVVQLEGRKRWYVSTDAPGLQNNWRQIGEPPTRLERHRAIDLGPGDLLYIPRGTPHTVEGATESLHLAILFIPTTLRDVVLAAIDHLADEDRAWRETAVGRAGGAAGGLSPRVLHALETLLARCRSGAFVDEAMEHRSSRFVADLPTPARPRAAPDAFADLRVRHAPGALFHLRRAGHWLDFAFPGDRLSVHPGVETELRFIRDTPEFRIRDIPGASSLEVRAALVGRLMTAGLLEPATLTADPRA